MSRVITKERTRAELSTISAMLEQMSDERVLERMGLESRRDELAKELELRPEFGRAAQVVLSFDGGPVRGTLGIEAKFATNAVGKFQDLVSRVSARSRFGTLASLGPIPDERSSRLTLTNVIHGSFGFELAELDQPLVERSSLDVAVDDTIKLLQSSRDSDEAFADAIAEEGPRVGESVKAFLQLLRTEQAAVRIRSDDTAVEFEPGMLDAVLERVESTEVEETIESVTGIFQGVLATSRRFELQTQDGRTLNGRLSLSADPSSFQEWFMRPCIARLNVVRTRKGARTTEKHTLIDLARSDS